MPFSPLTSFLFAIAIYRSLPAWQARGETERAEIEQIEQEMYDDIDREAIHRGLPNDERWELRPWLEERVVVNKRGHVRLTKESDTWDAEEEDAQFKEEFIHRRELLLDRERNQYAAWRAMEQEEARQRH